MSKIIAIANQKGGVGKTTTAINLGIGLVNKGNRVLLVDLDPQGNATQGLGFDADELEITISTILRKMIGKDYAIMKGYGILSHEEGIDLMPANIELSVIETELISTFFGREKMLKTYLDMIRDEYDYIIIDCPPTLDVIVTNALTASNSVIIPVQCEFFALEGITQLLKTIMLAQKTLNPTLDIEGVLLTMLDSRTNLGFEVVEDIRSFFKEKVYNTIIPRLVRLTEAPSYGKPIIAYDPKSRGSEAYINLAKEVIERNGK